MIGQFFRNASRWFQKGGQGPSEVEPLAGLPDAATQQLMEAINGAVALFRDYKRTRNTADLSRALHAYGQLDRTVPRNRFELRTVLVYNHGLALKELATTNSDETLAAQAAVKLQEALDSGMFKGRDVLLPLGDLAASHALRAQIGHKPEVLREAEVWTRRFMDAAGPDHELYPGLHLQLATLLLLLHEQTKEVPVAFRAVEVVIKAHRLGADGMADLACSPRFNHAVNTVLERPGSQAYIDTLVEVAEAGAEGARSDNRLRANWLDFLGRCLYKRWLLKHCETSRERAFAAIKQRLVLLANGERQRVVGRYLPGLLEQPEALQNEFYELILTCPGDDELKAAVAARPHLDKVLHLDPVTDQSIQEQWTAAMEFFVRNHERPNPNDVVELADRMHVLVTTPGFRMREIAFQAHALDIARDAFFHAYWWTGDFDRLDTAIVMGREAYDMVRELERSGGGQGRSEGAAKERMLMLGGLPVTAHALGVLLTQKCELTGDVDLIDEAVELGQEAVDHWAGALGHMTQLFHGGLATSLRVRFGMNGSQADLENALKHHRQAVTLERKRMTSDGRYDFVDGQLTKVLPGPENLIHLLGNLGNALRLYFARFEGREHLVDAIQCHEEVLSLSGEREASYPRFVSYLLDDLELAVRAGMTGFSTRLEEICAQGAVLAEGAPNHLLSLHRHVGDRAFGRQDWALAGTAFGHAARDRELLQAVQLDMDAKQSWLVHTQGLTACHAYALAKLDRLEEAVQALESGLARLIMESLWWSDSQLETLRTTMPAAVESLRVSRQQLRELGRNDILDSSYAASVLSIDHARVRRSAWAALKAAEQAVLQALGDDRRYREASASGIRRALLAANPDRAVVYLCTTRQGSLALILTLKTIEVVWPPLVEEQLLTLSDDLRLNGHARLGCVLGQLGENLMEPVAARLESLKAQSVVLVPTGRLALVPLHAASIRLKGGEKAFIDRFAVSYAPNASVMVANGGREAHGGVLDHPVAFGDPLSSASPLLPGANTEMHAIKALLTHGFAEMGWAFNATREAFFDLSRRATVLHFVGHGVSDPWSALDSHLVLTRNERLSVADLLAGNLKVPPGALAVLSACETAVVDSRTLPDESMGLPAALLVAGYSRVVGSLWKVDDCTTSMLMIRFYELLQQHSATASPCEIFREAIVWLKHSSGQELNHLIQKHGLPFPLMPDEMAVCDAPELWAGFVYLGM